MRASPRPRSKPTPDEVAEAAARLDRHDWSAVRLPTEAEIEAVALSDPDNPPLTDVELDDIARQARERDGRVAIAPPAAE